MNFPGLCKLQLTDQAVCQAIEGALNDQRRDGEDYIRVTDFARVGYGYGDWLVTLTTDVPQADVVTLATDEISKEAA